MSTNDLREQLQQTLGSSYCFERELGGGGMSRVFLAEDRALGRDIVVKVLSPAVAADLSAERFAREIKMAARLQQANMEEEIDRFIRAVNADAILPEDF